MIIDEVYEKVKMSNELNHQLERAVFIEKNLQKVKELISAGADTNMVCNMITCSAERGSLLHRCPNPQIARELILRGVSVNGCNVFGETPLHVASCCDNSLEVVKVLLQFGASVDAVTNKGNTALDIAVKSRCSTFEIMKILLENGADINVPSRKTKCRHHHYSTPLGKAMDELPVAKLLIKIYLIKNFYLNSKIAILDPYIERQHYSELVDFLNDCMIEIVTMQSEMMDNHTSLYDLMIRKDSVLKLVNEWVKKIEEVVNERYPIYHDVISDNIKYYSERWELLNKLRDLPFFTTLKPEERCRQTKIVIDPYSTHKIGKYLSNKDLSNLVIALTGDPLSDDHQSVDLSGSDQEDFPVIFSEHYYLSKSPESSCLILHNKIERFFRPGAFLGSWRPTEGE